MKKEIWKDVKGFEGLYQVSNHGRVKSTKVKIYKSTRRSVNLFGKKKNESTTVARLVATYFVPNPDKKPIVRYKKMANKENIPSNLEWITYSELGRTNKLMMKKIIEGK